MSITAIPTKYKNYCFRSRLEAKWAVFFDLIGVIYDYEQEGFKLPDGKYYLPDFYIPDYGYIEIKPFGEVSEDCILKCILLSKSLRTHVTLIQGSPSPRSYRTWYDGEETCSVFWSDYSVSKWDNTPYFSGEPALKSHSMFFSEQSYIDANSEKFGEGAFR